METNTKSANELYRESGSKLSFKDWITAEKKKGHFIGNKKLNEKIMNFSSQGQHSFHSADGNIIKTAATDAAALAKKTITAPVKYVKGLGHHDILLIVAGAAAGIGIFLIVKTFSYAK